jgi:hypothetical protein
MLVAIAILILLLAYFATAFYLLLALEYGGCCKLANSASNSATVASMTIAGAQGVGTPTVVGRPTPESTSQPSGTNAGTTQPKSPFWNCSLIEPFCAEFRKESGLNPQILLWGFLGGVVWCMYGLGRWYSRRLFDWHYLFWYIVNPWIALALGGIFSLTILSGLIPATTPNAGQAGSLALLYLVSFTVGLATHKFLKLLVRIITSLFGQVGPQEKSGTGSK